MKQYFSKANITQWKHLLAVSFWICHLLLGQLKNIVIPTESPLSHENLQIQSPQISPRSADHVPLFPHISPTTWGSIYVKVPTFSQVCPGGSPLPQGCRWHVHKTTKNFILLIKKLIQNSLSSSTWMFTLQVRILKHLKISLNKMWLTVAPVDKITLSNLYQFLYIIF